jgi:hypothetical protein
LRYFFHLGLFVQKERLEFRFFSLGTLKFEQRPLYLLILRKFIINKNILHCRVFRVRLRHNYYYYKILCSIYYTNIRTPRDSNIFKRRWDLTEEVTKRERGKKWIADKLFGPQEIETSLKINSIGVVSRYTLIRDQTDTKEYFIYININYILYTLNIYVVSGDTILYCVRNYIVL